jgi:hypothetical protein
MLKQAGRTIRQVWERLQELRSRANSPSESAIQLNPWWARVVSALAEVPEQYRGFLRALPPEHQDPFPYTALTPSFRDRGEPESEKLVCQAGKSSCIVEEVDGRLSMTCFPITEICMLEHGSILLHSWITIYGRTGCDGRMLPSVEHDRGFLQRLGPPLDHHHPAAFAY